MAAFFPILFVLVLDPAGVELEIDGTLPEYHLKAEVARDGSFLLAYPRVIYHWNASGKLKQRLDMNQLNKGGEPIFVATVVYDIKTGIYWIVDGKSHASFFVNEQGEFLGRSLAVHRDGVTPLFIRDLTMVGNRFFALDGDVFSSSWGQSDRGLFQQVSLENESGEPRVVLVGEPFGQPTELQREYAYDFKLHWMVQDGFTKNFFIVNQLSTSVKILTARGGEIDQYLEDSGETIPLIMATWVETPSRRNGKPRPNPSEYSTLSQIVGFCAVANDLLIVWSTPDLKAPQGVRLGMQRFDKQGILRGDLIETTGKFLGVCDETAYFLDILEDASGEIIYRIRPEDLSK